MKAELVDVNETRKSLSVEIPSDVVDAQIERVARDYSRRARIPGFRPGKVPARVVKQRFKDQILHDVAHDLVPKAVDEALRERGVEPVTTPDIREVVVEEGRALTFTASFDTLPSFEVGDLELVEAEDADGDGLAHTLSVPDGRVPAPGATRTGHRAGARGPGPARCAPRGCPAGPRCR